MPPERITLEHWIAPLVPPFLERRLVDLAALQAALATGDEATMRAIGHRLRGTCGTFGLAKLSAYGADLEACPPGGDFRPTVAAIAHFLATCEITYA